MLLSVSARLLAVSGLLVLAGVAAGGTVSLTPIADNTLYEVNAGPEVSNALGPNVFVGLTNGNERRRALLRFDLSSIPAGSVIESVDLQMSVNRGHGAGLPFSLYRVISAWGQGTSLASEPGGTGTSATPNDPTWVSSYFGSTLWNSGGGDFLPSSATATMVEAGSQVVWQSTPELVADVQAWLNNPGQNFGWIIIGGEGSIGSAVRLSSRESSVSRPTLLVTFTAGSTCGNADFNGDGDFGTDQDIEAFFACLSGNCCATCWPGGSDFNGDGDFGTDGDIEAFFRVLAGGSC
jgi:hypothetical protein